MAAEDHNVIIMCRYVLGWGSRNKKLLLVDSQAVIGKRVTMFPLYLAVRRCCSVLDIKVKERSGQEWESRSTPGSCKLCMSLS